MKGPKRFTTRRNAHGVPSEQKNTLRLEQEIKTDVVIAGIMQHAQVLEYIIAPEHGLFADKFGWSQSPQHLFFGHPGAPQIRFLS